MADLYDRWAAVTFGNGDEEYNAIREQVKRRDKYSTDQPTNRTTDQVFFT
jgi:hypothetical protein